MHEGRSAFLYSAGRMLDCRSKSASANSRFNMCQFFFRPKTFYPHWDANIVPTHCRNGSQNFEVNSKVMNNISSNDDSRLFTVLFGSVVYLEIVIKVAMRSKFNQLVTKVDGCSGGK